MIYLKQQVWILQLILEKFPFFESNIVKTNESFNQAYDKLRASLQVENLDLLYGEIENLEEAVILFQRAWEEKADY